MRKKIFNNQNGISLLEVLIGMLVLAFGVLGLAPLFTLAVEGNVVSRDTSLASNLINEQIEYYQSVDSDSLPTVPFTRHEQGLDSMFTRSTFLNDNTSDTTVPAGVYKLDVVVSWTDNQSVSRSSMYSTFLLK